MVLDRPWHQLWDYHPELLDTAATRVRELHEAAARPGQSDSRDPREVKRLLAHELIVPAALEAATKVGGDAPGCSSRCSAPPDRVGFWLVAGGLEQCVSDDSAQSWADREQWERLLLSLV